MVAGPEIVLEVTRIAEPSAPVWNAVAVETPDAVKPVEST